MPAKGVSPVKVWMADANKAAEFPETSDGVVVTLKPGYEPMTRWWCLKHLQVRIADV
jgi:hypothetical protein